MPSRPVPAGIGAPWRRDRRGQVHRDAHLRRSLSARHPARPPDDRRHPNTALPERCFAMEQRRIARQPLAAVVVGENHQRISREPISIEARQDLTDARVSPLEHLHVVLTGGIVGIAWHLRERPTTRKRVRLMMRRLKRPMTSVVLREDVTSCQAVSPAQSWFAPRKTDTSLSQGVTTQHLETRTAATWLHVGTEFGPYDWIDAIVEELTPSTYLAIWGFGELPIGELSIAGTLAYGAFEYCVSPTSPVSNGWYRCPQAVKCPMQRLQLDRQ